MGSPRPIASKRLSVLLLCDDDPKHANTVLEHVEAIRRYSVHDVRTFNPRSLPGSRTLDLREFDVVVIHYSLCIIVDDYFAPAFREKLRRFGGLKVQFIQDDYRWVDRIAAMMRDLEIGVLFTLVPPPEIPRVWSAERLPGTVKIGTLAGYVPESLIGLPVRPLDDRPIDIGYRGRELPYWLGRLGQDKVRIAQGVLARVKKYGLRCDIAWTEKDRIYGPAWTEFIGSCRAILGTESGASITDFDGSIEERVRTYLAQYPGADFEEVHRATLTEFEANVRMNVISPRIFEAVALRTPMILFPGEYSGVIRPWDHYIPLEPDFSNMDEVVERLRDTQGLETMRDRAYEDVVRTGRYSPRVFVRELDESIERYAVPRGRSRKMWYYAALAERHVERAARLIRLREWLLHGSRIGSGIGSRIGSRIGRAIASPIWHLAKRGVAASIGVKLVLRYREARQLLFLVLRSREVRQAVRPATLLKELLRLWVLRKACGDMRSGPERFRVSIRLERTGVEFRSHGAPVKECRDDRDFRGPWAAEIADAAIDAFHAGKFAVVWNHSALGEQVSFALTRRTWVPLKMGERGVHDFPAFRGVAVHFPEHAWAVLAAVLNAGVADHGFRADA